MKITKKSLLTGIEHTREIDITMDQYIEWCNGALIQNVMKNISAEDREFILSGITPEEWENEFGEDDD